MRVSLTAVAALLLSTARVWASAADSHLRVPLVVWEGEVFPIRYTIEAERSYNPSFGVRAMQWDAAPLSVEPWSGPERFETASSGAVRVGMIYRTRALARQAGTVALNPASEVIELSVPTSGFGFYQQRQAQPFSVQSDAPEIRVRPLPDAPSGFTGAVGQFSLASRVAPRTVAVGEPVTWTLELEGTGNWPQIVSLPAREASGEFKLVQPRSRTTHPRGSLFDGSMAEDAILMPSRSGSFSLGPVSFVYFDPQAGEYRTIEAASMTVEVVPATRLPSASEPASSTPPPRSPAAQAAPAAPAPVGIGAAGPLPIPAGAFARLLIAPLLAALAAWLGIAGARAALSDPGRPRRAARKRAIAALENLANSSDSGKAAAIREWMESSSILLGIGRAAPTVREVASASPEWSELWAQADRALFGPEAELPNDWGARARKLLDGRPAPSFDWDRLFRWRNLIPPLACAVLLLGAAGSVRAADAASQMSPDWAQVERSCRERLAVEPCDWGARHDLSLALSQLGHEGEAASQAACAFVQQPQNSRIRLRFGAACDEAGYYPDALTSFSSPGPAARFCELLSPARWQRLAIAWMWGASIATALALAAAFGQGRLRKALAPACWALAFCLLACGCSLGAARAYGDAGDIRSVICWKPTVLRPVPTEADPSQRTALMPAGAIAIADRRFLGWVHLRSADATEGWCRAGETVAIWQ